MSFVAQSVKHFNDTPQYLKLLLQLGANQTPFLTVAGQKGIKLLSDKTFDMAQEWDVGAGQQTGLSEDEVCTGVSPTRLVRTVEQNGIQLFERIVDITYLRQSITSGLSNQLPDGASFDPSTFQIQGALAKIQKDWDYSALNGTLAIPTTSALPFKMGGVITSVITDGSNYVDGAAAALDRDLLNSLFVQMYATGANFTQPALVVGPSTKVAISKLYGQPPLSINIGGVAVERLVTDFGVMDIILDVNVPANTILVADMANIYPAILPMVTGQDIVVERKQETGACEKWLVYGQLSVDFGSPKIHGVLNNFTV